MNGFSSNQKLMLRYILFIRYIDTRDDIGNFPGYGNNDTGNETAIRSNGDQRHQNNNEKNTYDKGNLDDIL